MDIKIELKNNRFVISLEKNSPLMPQIKNLPNRRFDWDIKKWIAPATPKNIIALAEKIEWFKAEYEIELDDQVQELLANADQVELPPDKILKISGKKLIFEYDYNPALNEVVKRIDAKFRKTPAPHWYLNISPETIEKALETAKTHGFHIEPEVTEAAAALVQKQQENLEASKAEDAKIIVENLGGELRPFQRGGVAYASANKRTFIADEMGLGKTVEALATLEAANAYPALIVCPASLKLNWEREAKKWLPGRTVSVTNGKKGDFTADILIINYDILGKNKADLIARNNKAVVLDESHYIKNHKAQRTAHAKEIAKGAEIRLCLTGTPVLNRPQELLSQLGFLGRLDDLGGFWNFAKRYCNAHQTRFGWDFSGAAHLDELNEKLRQNCYIRRNKADVLKELPAKQRSILEVEIDNRREYGKAERELITWLGEQAAADKEFLASIAGLPEDEQKKAKANRAMSAEAKAGRAEQLVRIEALKQLGAKGKMKAVTEWVESFLETGEKLVLFAHHQSVINDLAEKFNALTVTGQTPMEKRQEYVDRFQNDPDCNLIVLNIRAGGVGLTLTAASNVAFVELDWTPAAHDQAEDRCHRIGQENSVNAWYLLARDTIDQDIYSLIEKKRQVVDAATEGAETEETASILKGLLAKLQK